MTFYGVSDTLYSVLENPSVVGTKRPRCYWVDGGDTEEAIRKLTEDNKAGWGDIPEDSLHSLYGVEEHYKKVKEPSKYKQFLVELSEMSEKKDWGVTLTCAREVHNIVTDYAFSTAEYTPLMQALDALQAQLTTISTISTKTSEATYPLADEERHDFCLHLEIFMETCLTTIKSMNYQISTQNLTSILIFMRIRLIELLNGIHQCLAVIIPKMKQMDSKTAYKKNIQHASATWELLSHIIKYWQLVMQKAKNKNFQSDVGRELITLRASPGYIEYVIVPSDETNQHILRVVANIDFLAAFYYCIQDLLEGRSDSHGMLVHFVPNSMWDSVTWSSHVKTPSISHNPALNFLNAEGKSERAEESSKILKMIPLLFQSAYNTVKQQFDPIISTFWVDFHNTLRNGNNNNELEQHIQETMNKLEKLKS